MYIFDDVICIFLSDGFQSLMMFGSIVAVIVAGALNVGSVGKAFEIAGNGDRLHLFEMSPGEKKRHYAVPDFYFVTYVPLFC